ncbi:LapA family protein [Methylobacterium sp. JK268]
MIRFLKGLILLPVAVVVVLLAVANRQPVTLSFDPFTEGAPVFSLTVPLYALLFAAVALGILVGGCGAWLGEGQVRRDRRAKAREVERLRAESERLRVAANRALPAPTARA